MSERSSEVRDVSPVPSCNKSMDPELRDLLAGVNQDALTILADNDICSVDDAKMLSATDLDEMYGG